MNTFSFAVFIITLQFALFFKGDHPHVRVIDGDTVEITDSNNTKNPKFKLRLYGIDAPESTQFFGSQSKDQLLNYIGQGSLTYTEEFKKPDIYGRLIVTLYSADSISINEKMLRSGCAWAYTKYLKSKDKKRYLLLEDSARQEKRGLWGIPNPIMPSVYRKTN